MFNPTVALLLLSLTQHVLSYKILAIISLPLKSHYMAMQPLFKELAAKGHSVTVVNNFPDENPVNNLHFIDLKTVSSANKFPTLEYYEDFDSNYLHLFNFYRHLTVESQFNDCETLFKNEELRTGLAGGNFDVVFVEGFMSDCALAIAGALSDAPIISIASHVMLPWMYPRLGLSFDPSSDAFYFSNGGPNPPIINKVESFLMHAVFNTVGRWYIQRGIRASFANHLPGYELDVEEIARERMKMLFSYQHFSVTGARPLAPQVLEIGGLHVEKPKALPKDVDMFLSEATHGAIYVSFGSNLKSSSMSPRKLEQFLDAFKRIHPIKVLFKWENGSIPDENVLAKSWFPQLDVLCHPKLIGFVSHGGMLSTSEAANCGVPMVAVPFFGDQFGNAASIKAAGLGTTVFFDRLTGDSLAAAIKDITSAETQEKAKKIARLWNDRPMSALDSAIYWTEYVARHKQAPPSLPSKASWCQTLPIDVYSVLLLISLLFLVVFVLICKLFKAIVVMLFFKRKIKGD